MTDPIAVTDSIAVKNAKRTPAEHRIEDVRFRVPGTYLTCSCGWSITFDDALFTPEIVEMAWNTHKKVMGVSSR